MSKTIVVFPVSTVAITFRDVFSLAERRISEYLESVGVLYYPDWKHFTS